MHSIELLPDEATERVVRRVWRSIADEGLPSQAGHRHPTNRPHLTLATADALPAATRGALAEALDALPLPLHLTGLLRFSGRNNVLAWAVRPDAALLALHERVWRILRETDGDGRSHPLLAPGRWVPHITLGRGAVPSGPAPTAGGFRRGQRYRDGGPRPTYDSTSRTTDRIGPDVR
ncbi:2'-5' RNA ligase family protein [Streptomyces sp. MT29]|nr:2'-5' RNA ligase family protein [Streptomyces sp. MT29]